MLWLDLAPAQVVSRQALDPSQMASPKAVATPTHQGIGVAFPAQTPDIVVTAPGVNDPSNIDAAFSEDQIEVFGEDDIRGVLNHLQSFIDPTGNELTFLINGRPAGFDQSILSFPPEALEKITVLKQSAGMRYGGSFDHRVVNLVLKKKFESLSGDAGLSMPFRGGKLDENTAFSRSSINGDTRWNAQIQFNNASDLLRSSRNVPALQAGADSVGYVTNLNNQEIDPELSALSGQTVTIAPIPAGTISPPNLADFAANKALHPVDPNRYQTLLPATQSITGSFDLSHPIGTFTASLTASASHSLNDGLNGLPMVALILPSASPWSPFKADVNLIRPFSGTRALKNNSDQTSISATLVVNGNLLGFQTSASLNASQNIGNNLTETGVQIAAIQSLLDNDPAFDPFADFGDGLLALSRSHSRSTNMNAQLSLQRNFITLPAGPVNWNFSLSSGRSETWVSTDQQPEVASSSYRSTYSQVSGQLALSFPVSRRGSRFHALGDLSANLVMGEQSATGSAWQPTIGGGAVWSPASMLQLNGSLQIAKVIPSSEELDSPIVTTVTNVFDYARQAEVETLWKTGGNPGLRGGTRKSLSLSMTLRPPRSNKITLSMNYVRTVASNSPTGFPELTPAVEAAFPDRIQRDAAGNLVSVDARPINAERSDDATLNSGVTLRLDGTGRPSTQMARNANVDPVHAYISIDDRFWIKSNMLVRAGLPVINWLSGGSPTSRHAISLQLDIGKRSFGWSINGTWSSPTHVSSDSTTFKVTPPLTVNLSSFIMVGQVFRGLDNFRIAHALKFSVSISNILNQYRRTTLPNGNVPANYSHDEIDPLGRTLRFSVRSRF